MLMRSVIKYSKYFRIKFKRAVFNRVNRKDCNVWRGNYIHDSVFKCIMYQWIIYYILFGGSYVIIFKKIQTMYERNLY
jgi:hypothetical protein